jgi:hypothetical protein
LFSTLWVLVWLPFVCPAPCNEPFALRKMSIHVATYFTKLQDQLHYLYKVKMRDLWFKSHQRFLDRTEHEALLGCL